MQCLYSDCRFAGIISKTGLFVMLVLLCPSWVASSAAQPPQTRINIQLLGPDQGLPSRNTRSLTQDGRGFMWVGTGQDLWRYDGYTFQNFTGLLSRSIGGRTLINQIQTSPKGDIWVVHNSGITIIDPANLNCTSIDPSRYLKEIDSKQNLNVFFDKKQNAWVAIPRGKLIRINKDLVPVALYSPEAGQQPVPVGNVVINLFYDQKENTYAYSNGNFLDQVDHEGKVTRRINLLSGLPAGHVPVDGVVQADPESLTIYYKRKADKEGRMRKYVFKTQTFTAIQKANTPIIPDYIHAAPKGYTWYKTEEEIGFLNQNTGIFTSITERLVQKSGANVYIFGSYLSSDGSFWILCMDGLFKITLTEELFRKYLSVQQPRPGDIGSSIRGLTEDSSGLIWVCSYGHIRDGKPYLLHQIDPVTGLTRHMQLHRPRNIPGDAVIPYKVLLADEKVYAVTDGTQFLEIDPAREEYYPVEFPFVSGRGFTSFYRLNEHTFWLGTWGGMGVIDTRNLKPVLLNDRPGPYIRHVRVNHFMRWSGNSVLVSTTNGLYVLNQDATVREHFGQELKDRIKLPASQIYHTIWHENTLWAGSAEGLIRIDTTRKAARLFTIQDGLPDNTIYAALPDSRGNLWLSTNKGLSRFNTRTEKFHNYGISDGLPHTEFNHGSYLQAKDGTLYFGGLNGIVSFDPARVDIGETKEDALQLISYSKYDVGSNRNDTVTSYKPGSQIVFQPGDRLFAFYFMSPNYQNTALNRFRYKLEGWDDDRWQMFESGNRLRLNSLPPGNYKLRVQVSIAGADWSSQEWQAPVKVLAPWYKSAWFIVLAIVALIAIFYSVYRYRLRQVMQIQQIRNGISADMHDEIGSTLSSITFYSQALLMQMEKAEHQQVMRKIKENAQQVQEGLSDIVWSVKAGSDEIEDVFARMLQFGSELADSKGFAFQFETDTRLENTKLNMYARKNLYLIFKEAINNAAKYAACSEVKVHISEEKGKVKMVIADNGKGFDHNSVKKGNGLTNMQQRAVQIKAQLTIHSGKEMGTTVTLIF